MLRKAQIRRFADMFLNDLQHHRLVVAKVRSRDNGWVRITVSVNPEWYQKLCSQWIGRRGQRGGKHRRPRTIIKRQQVIVALKKLQDEPRCEGAYVERVRDIMEWWMGYVGEPSSACSISP